MDIMLLVALGALLILFMFNSRRKQKARMQEISDNLVPGATVMTGFGLYGTVVSVDEENMEVLIESGPGTLLRIHRQAVGQVTSPEGSLGSAGATSTAGGAAADSAPRITDEELDEMNRARQDDEFLTESDEDRIDGDSDDPTHRDDKN